MELTTVTWFARFAWFVGRRASGDRLEHRVLRSVAGTNGRAAARALLDSRDSSDPHSERLQALTLLRSSYESYLEHAESTPTGLTLLWPWPHRRAVADARFNAALCALAMARIYHLTRNRRQKKVWRDLAHEHYLVWKGPSSAGRALPKTALALLAPVDERDTGQEGVSPEPVPDDRLRQEFEDACTQLYWRGQRSRVVWDQPVDCVA